jgi:flagellum-specific peptidoglycan hydrolase FlgJ
LLSSAQLKFLDAATKAAEGASHAFPRMAACEAAEESRFGTSLLATQDNNLFGMKQHRHAIYGTHSLPTKEFQNGEWVTVAANFLSYPSWAACFQDRMVTLLRLAAVYPHYGAALAAKDAETYVREVSATWSTDPRRAEKVLAIFHQYTSPIAADIDGEISV